MNSTVGNNSAGDEGGGIYAYYDVSLTDSTVIGNSAGNDGGGILAGDEATLTGSTVSGNSAGGNGGGVYADNVTASSTAIENNSADGDGGGIYASNSVTLTDSTVDANSAARRGGGIHAESGATLTGSTVSGNSATLDGGGISSGNVSLTDSTVSDNSAGYDGGGIRSLGDVMLSGSTVSGNMADEEGGGIRASNVSVTDSTINANYARDDGGGIRFVNSLSVVNSTISGNSADSDGGGIYTADGIIAVSYSTITANSATGEGGGIGLRADNGGESLTIINSIVAGNTASDAPDFVAPGDPGANLDVTWSLIGNESGTSLDAAAPATNLIGTDASPLDPLLGPLQDNGGSTFTHALLDDSPAIDAGDPTAVAGVGNVPLFDQRGAPYGRVVDGDIDGTSRIDMGAFERAMPPVTRDYGDAPLNFPTQAANNGASHIVDVLFLGQYIDAEVDGTPSLAADADDNNLIPDDEDGITFTQGTTMFAGQQFSFTVDASQAGGYLRIWIDLNGNGVWEASEKVHDAQMTDTSEVVTVDVPGDASIGDTYLRVRLSSAENAGGENPGGADAASGEVEDYVLQIDQLLADFGDAPDSYGTLLASDGARHQVLDNDLFFGEARDAEANGIASADALGDDLTFADDEDGINLPAFFTPGQNHQVSVTVSEPGWVDAWIDWNGDGTFDPVTEQLFGGSGYFAGRGTFFVNVNAPADAAAGQTFARFRISSIGNLSPTGLAPDGEVEDYQVLVAGEDENSPPVVSNPIPDQTATAGSPFSFTFPEDTFTDPDGDALSYTASLTNGDPLPAWLNFDGATRTFSGTPAAGNVGTLNIRVTANDGNGGSADDDFDLVVQTGNTPPVVANPIPNQAATVGIPFNFQFAADTFTDADGDALSYTATLSNGNALPAWLNFDGPTRTFSGTPAAGDVGTLSLRVTADDGNGGSADDDFDLVVQSGNTPPVVANPIPDQTATVADPFNFQFAADTFTDADGDTLSYTATLTNGNALPAWLNFDGPTRTFSGTPAAGDVGTLEIRVTADDGNGGAVGDDFNLTVEDDNQAPIVANPIPDQTATADDPFNFQFAANTFEDPDGDPLTYASSLSNGNPLPAWLNFSAATRTFSGTPTAGDVGTIVVRVTATDPGGLSVPDDFNLNVQNNAARTLFSQDFSNNADGLDTSTGWQRVNGEFQSNPNTRNAVSLITDSSVNPLPGDVNIQAQVRVTPSNGSQLFSNGYIVFDYQDANNYKLAGVEAKNKLWVISEVVNGVYNQIVSRFDSSISQTGTYQLDVDVTSSGVTMRTPAGQLFVQSSTFANSGDLRDGDIGLGTILAEQLL